MTKLEELETQMDVVTLEFCKVLERIHNAEDELQLAKFNRATVERRMVAAKGAYLQEKLHPSETA